MFGGLSSAIYSSEVRSWCHIYGPILRDERLMRGLVGLGGLPSVIYSSRSSRCRSVSDVGISTLTDRGGE